MKVLAAIIPGFSVAQSYRNHNNNKLLPIWPKSGTICLKIDFGWIYSIYVTGNAAMTVHVPVYSPFSSIGRNCVHPFSHHNNSFVLPLSTFLVSTVSAQHHPSISPSRSGFLWESDRDAALFILCVELTRCHPLFNKTDRVMERETRRTGDWPFALSDLSINRCCIDLTV